MPPKLKLVKTPNRAKLLEQYNDSLDERNKQAYEIAKDAVKIGAKVLWLQLGIREENAKKLIEENKMEYIENKCTKMEYQKHFLKVRPAFPVLSD